MLAQSLEPLAQKVTYELILLRGRLFQAERTISQGSIRLANLIDIRF